MISISLLHACMSNRLGIPNPLRSLGPYTVTSGVVRLNPIFVRKDRFILACTFLSSFTVRCVMVRMYATAGIPHSRYAIHTSTRWRGLVTRRVANVVALSISFALASVCDESGALKYPRYRCPNVGSFCLMGSSILVSLSCSVIDGRSFRGMGSGTPNLLNRQWSG